MRTTVEIDDQVLAVARALASSRGQSLGAAISELARRGIDAETRPAADLTYSPFPVIVGDSLHVVTPDLVAQHQDD